MSPTMEVLLFVLLVFTAVVATVVVFTKDPARQAIVLSAYGLLLGVLMLTLQAPDVAMSQIAVGSVVVPLLVVLTIAKCDREVAAHRSRHRDRQGR